MQKAITYIILVAFFLSGLLLVYRSALQSNDLEKVQGRVTHKTIEQVHRHKGKYYYAVTFRLEGHPTKLGMYNGQESYHPVISEVDTVSIYTFLIDPTVTQTVNGLNLGIREIYSGDIAIYKESNLSSLVGGMIFCMMALIAGGLLWVYDKKKRNRSAFK